MLQRRLLVEWALIALFACLAVGVVAVRGWTSAIDDRIYDLTLSVAQSEPDDRILLVTIDDASLRTIGRWPWPRAQHARMVDALNEAGTRAIGYDVLFQEPGPDDPQLAEAMARARTVFIPALTDDNHSPPEVVPPEAMLERTAAGLGGVELPLDADGVFRRDTTSQLTDRGPLPSLAARLAGSVGASAAPPGGFLVSYVDEDSFRRVPFASVIKGEVPAAALKDKLVLVGFTAAGMGDDVAMAGSGGSRLAGVELQAEILNTLLQGHPAQVAPPFLRAAFCLVPVIALLIAFLIWPPAVNSALATGLFAITLFASPVLLVAGRVWAPPGAALAGLVAVYALWGWRRLTAVNRYLTARAISLSLEPGVQIETGSAEPRSEVIVAEAERLDGVIVQLGRLRRLLAEVVEQHPEALCLVDTQERIVLGNKAADVLYGKPVAGSHVGEFARHLGTKAFVDGAQIRHPDGKVLLVSRAALEGGNIIVAFVDITELQKAASERDEILQFLSHDIRMPQAAIVTLLETQAITAQAGKQVILTPGLLDQIRTHAHHGLRLADDFVQLSRARRREMEIEPVELCDLVREACDMVWPRASSRAIKVEDRCGEDEIWVSGDKGLLLRAAINLLDNAVKFAPAGATVHAQVSRSGNVALMAVRGPAPELPGGRADDPFALYGEGRDADGTPSIGLGLAFVQTATARHGGTVDYSRSDDGTTTFCMRLPALDPEG